MRRARTVLAMALGAGALAAAIAIVAALARSSDSGGDKASSLPPAASTAAVAELAPTAPAVVPVTPTPLPAAANVTRLVIPSIKVDAPAVGLGVDASGTMEAPSTPTDVAWYDFAAKPGSGGNVVLAGHVDYRNYGPAVFWRLRELKPGDEIQVITDDGKTHSYYVVSLTAYDEATAPVHEIVGPTATETLTLITCAGTFDNTRREYDKRLVVRAQPTAAQTSRN